MDYDSYVTTVVTCMYATVRECVKEFAPILELCEAWCQDWGSDKCIVCIGTPMPSFLQPTLTTCSGGVFPRVSLARARHIEPPIWTVAVTRWLNLKKYICIRWYVHVVGSKRMGYVRVYKDLSSASIMGLSFLGRQLNITCVAMSQDSLGCVCP